MIVAVVFVYIHDRCYSINVSVVVQFYWIFVPICPLTDIISALNSMNCSRCYRLFLSHFTLFTCIIKMPLDKLTVIDTEDVSIFALSALSV
jgi:hypothetical protein